MTETTLLFKIEIRMLENRYIADVYLQSTSQAVCISEEYEYMYYADAMSYALLLCAEHLQSMARKDNHCGLCRKIKR